jgi:predicted kinase
MIDGGVYSKGNERFILQMRNQLIINAVREGKHVIVDDTNLHPVHEKEIRAIVANNNSDYDDNTIVEINDSFLSVSPEECIERDLKREASVGSKVILDMARKYLPAYEYCVPEIDTKEAEANGLPWCVIYDLDGTAAIRGDRSPYDASRCDELDRINLPVLCTLNALRQVHGHGSYTMIAMSGRPSQYRDPTERFLDTYGFPCDFLYMRKEGDQRKDSVIKGELYDEHIKGKYNVLVVLDDRDQMVDYWRKVVGIPCWQVNYGDF